MSLRPLLATLLAALLAPSLTFAQGFLIDARSNVRMPRPIVRPTPQPTSSYKVQSIEVNAALKDRVAKVQVAQTFKNTGSRQLEVSFVFPLPYDGAVDSLTLLVDGKEYEAKLLPADEARRTYEEIVRRNKDPALLEWLGAGMFKTSVFPVPAGAERTVTLRYSQLCRKSQGLTDFLFPLSTAKYTSGPLDKLSIRLSIDSSAPLASVYSPSHEVTVDRTGPERAVVTYNATQTVPVNDFRLFFDTGKSGVGTSVISYRPDTSNPGYFLLLASPDIKAEEAEPLPKTVLFVVDRSGSMTGKKLEQAKGALKFVLNNLRDGDTFNIVAYDSQIESFRPEVERYTDETRRAALGFVDSLYAGGSTNIDGALKRALGMLQDSSQPSYVLFLTDGLPTAGESGESAIVTHAKSTNRVRARLFPFGVGYDVNSRLLDRLADANFGQTEYVRPDQDIEASVSKLYSRIQAPVMTDVTLAFDVEGAASAGGPVVNRVYPAGSFDLFAGEQRVILGRYRAAGAARVTLTGAVGGKEQAHRSTADLVEQSQDDANAFVARLWATRRVGEIINQMDLEGKNQELVDELVALATRHGIVTQYTSFLADEGADHNAVAGNRLRAAEESQALTQTSDRFGFSQRASKGRLMAAPRANAPASARGFGGGRAQLEQGRWGGNAFFYDARNEQTQMATNIRQIGRKTFFLRDGRWVDSTVDDEAEKNSNRIERFSKEYFDLARHNGRHVAQYLAIDEPVVVRIGGEVYSW